MRRLIAPLVMALVVASAVVTVALAQTSPQFKLGFKALADQVPDAVGQPLEEEHWGANGDSLQRTTTGLMVWRKADNWTAFTDGSRTWINGPAGVQDRPNDKRFDWENEATPVLAETSAQAPTSPTRRPVAEAPGAGWTLYDGSDDGFTLFLPPGWKAIDVTAADIAGQVNKAVESNPDLAPRAEGLAFSAKMLRMGGGMFMAFPAAADTGLDPMSAKIQLSEAEADPATWSKVVETSMAAIQGPLPEGMGSVSLLAHRRVALPAGDAEEYVLATKPLAPWIDATTMALDQYFLLRNGIGYTLIFTAPEKRLDELKPLFEKIAGSVRLCDRATPLPKLFPDLPLPAR